MPGFNACLGSLSLPLGPVVIETSVHGSHVSTVPGAPSPDLPLDCGPGCALAAEETLVFRAPSSGDNGSITIVAGHNQLRWGWSPGAKAWIPEPYGYANIGALSNTTIIANAQSPADYAAATTWVVWQRNLAYTVYEKVADGVFRITERNDALASKDKRDSPTKPPPVFMRGQTMQFVRIGPKKVLSKILDYRQPALESMVIDRDDGPDGPGTGRVNAVHYDVAGGSATMHYKLGYAGSGQLNSVQKDANDPSGVKFRRATIIQYVDATSQRFDTITDPFEDPIKYRWFPNGRLQSQAHESSKPAETTSLTFAYECGAGPCTAGQLPTKVTETDEDGYVQQTSFTTFPGTSTAIYVSEKARGVSLTAGSVTLDDSSRMLYRRDATGYLVRQYSVGERMMRSWNTDGSPARRARVVRTDQNVDISAFTAALPSKSIDSVDYEIAFFDGDNLPIKTIGPEGVRTYEYQKSIHANDAYSWAGNMLLKSTTKRMNADQTNPQEETTTEEVAIVTSAAAGSSGSPCASLYSGTYEFLVTVKEPMAGGVQCTWLDRILRPVASLAPGDGNLPSTVEYHPVYSLPETRKQPSVASTNVKVYGAGGYVTSETQTTCGATTYQRTYTLNDTTNSLTETIGGNPPVVTTNKLDPLTGASTEIRIQAAGYTKVSAFTYAPKSAALVRRIDTYTATGGDPVVENYSWYVKGYGGPP